MNSVRVRVAFVLAPLSAALVMVGASVVTGDVGWGMWVTLFLFSLGTFVVTACLGVPAFYLYQRRGVTSLLAYAAGGGGIGIATTAAVALLVGSTESAWSIRTLIIFMCAGTVSALVFRTVAGVGA
jgi:hypothetical protein